MNTTRPAGLALALAGLAALGLTAARPAQAQTAYAVDTQSLYTINLTTGAATLIGNDGRDLEGLAISPTGALFGTDSGGNLFSLSATTGAATLIGSTGLGNIEGLDFFGSTLIGSDFINPTTFYSINTATAAPTAIVSAATGVLRGIDATGPTSALVISDQPTFQTLQSVDLTSGTVTSIGTLAGTGISGDFSGLDFAANGNLYGVDSGGDFDQINPLTGATTLIKNDGLVFLDFKIAGTPAVPEASTTVSFGLLLALGMGGMVIAAKRKKTSV